MALVWEAEMCDLEEEVICQGQASHAGPCFPLHVLLLCAQADLPAPTAMAQTVAVAMPAPLCWTTPSETVGQRRALL